MSNFAQKYTPSPTHILDSVQARQQALVQLSPDLQDAIRRNPHVGNYLQKEWHQLGVPSFYKTLSREMRNWEQPNLIYPVGDPIFVHIFPDEKIKARHVYRVIEPRLLKQRDALLQKIESRIVAQVDEQLEVETQEEKLKVLIELLNKVVSVKGSPSRNRGDSGGFSIFKKSASRIPISRDEYQIVKYLLNKNRIGLGILEPLIRDPYIEDISCDGIGP
ncbi:MAG TPA: hypothetical protein VK503_04825, partial [Candidatus Bathyarchaeia archaeon]|nr:hypothetical protein [Candidatus Bathyarchaeia archaeon]